MHASSWHVGYFTMTTNWNSRVSLYQVWFCSFSLQVRAGAPCHRNRRPFRTLSALAWACAGHIPTQLYKKLLCCMEEQWCKLETPEFSAGKDSRPHRVGKQSAHTQMITEMLLQENTHPVTKPKQLCCLEMKFKCSSAFSNWLEIYTASQRYG